MKIINRASLAADELYSFLCRKTPLNMQECCVRISSINRPKMGKASSERSSQLPKAIVSRDLLGNAASAVSSTNLRHFWYSGTCFRSGSFIEKRMDFTATRKHQNSKRVNTTLA